MQTMPIPFAFSTWLPLAMSIDISDSEMARTVVPMT